MQLRDRVLDFPCSPLFCVLEQGTLKLPFTQVHKGILASAGKVAGSLIVRTGNPPTIKQ